MPTVPNIKLPTTDTTDAPGIDPKTAPYSAVVRITDTIDGVRYLGSGVLISPDEVLTANHVVSHQGSSNGVATAVEVDPGYNNDTALLGAYAGTVTHYTSIQNEPNISLNDVPNDYAIIHLSKPAVGASIMRVTPDFAGGDIHVSGYPAGNSGTGSLLVDSLQAATRDPIYAGVFEGVALSPGFSGSPVWGLGADGQANVYGVASASNATTSYDARFMQAAAQQIADWVKADDTVPPPPPPPLPPEPPLPPQPPLPLPKPPAHVAAVLIHDGTTGLDVPDTLSRSYTGMVNYLTTEFVDLSPDNLNVAAITPNIFIHTGSGNDGVSLLSGQNVVDGGMGSNFLVGGTGTDTFFLDARGAASDAWSTVSGFHSGDASTLFGVSQGEQTLAWVDGLGAAGATGLTLVATQAGKPNLALTLAGYSSADLTNGRLTTSFGADTAGSPYLYVHAT